MNHINLNELALFAGAGGGILGGMLLGWRTVCAVEIDAHARSALLARQRDGCLHRFPIWDDVRTFDGHAWRGHVDIITGGFPCQDISSAGKGAGITGARSGLWREFARIINEVRPRFALVENSPILTSRGLGTVLGDLASLGYDAEWGVLSAADAIWHQCDPVADHLRERIWVLAMANANGSRCSREGSSQSVGRECEVEPVGSCSEIPHPNGARLENGRPNGQPEGQDEIERRMAQPEPERRGCAWWSSEPRLGRVADGVANRVDRIRAIGNGQVPAVVDIAWKTLLRSFTTNDHLP